jgi:ADP-ribose pyrophosphatase YjhB (NUDIX family)
MAAAPAKGGGASSIVPPSRRDDGFSVVSEAVSYKRYLTLYDRTVEFPDHKAQYKYDVVGHPRAAFHFVSIFPYHADTGEVTMIREYAQGPNHFVWSFPAGGVDATRHASLEATATAELSEECSLLPGTLVRLLPADHPGILETKWCRCVFVAKALRLPETKWCKACLTQRPCARQPDAQIRAGIGSRPSWSLTPWQTPAPARATPRRAA